ncbi:DUF1302 family protein [Plasticicumulans acidivorans]|uniref:Porin n=1 Tax=Plasticicumulans acidivorans TaxID=886464 RepID=A0A317MTL1_9GAMM|nr:DUF1302 family protein [Plasticicumulans acidivorans]PWV60683.1 hypothetical protein C7443_107258 [Plasticicumulans acidivorans]
MKDHVMNIAGGMFGLALVGASAAVHAEAQVTGTSGFFSSEAAHTYSGEDHWSKFRNTLGLSADGVLNDSLSWKASTWLRYDPVYDNSSYYPHDVRADQRHEFQLRETYLDWSAGSWDFRFGRQQIVWGEMVGLFFADVVSARDMREFVMADFDQIRIPQWAARAEYFEDDFHAEAIFIPFQNYDEIGKPGADFYPYPPGCPAANCRILNERKPRDGNDDMAAGLRLGYLIDGWDVAGFYYRSTDTSPSFERSIIMQDGVPFIEYKPDHNRIQQWGLTVGKDLGEGMVFKSEAIYTQGRRYDVLRFSDADGLVRKDTFDYVLGLEYSGDASSRVNVQFFQRIYDDYDEDMIPDRVESGASLYLTRKFWGDRLEPEVTFIRSTNRDDWALRPRLTWHVNQDVQAIVGVDVMHGPPDGLFGRFTNDDRVYGEVRVNF